MTTFAFLIEPPFNYRRPDGSPTGCDIELARMIFGMIGKNEVDFVETEFAQLLPGLQNGRWHMTTGLFATETAFRLQAIDQPPPSPLTEWTRPASRSPGSPMSAVHPRPPYVGARGVRPIAGYFAS